MIINQLSNAISISYHKVENILHNGFDMMNVSAWLVSHLLSPDQKHTRLIILEEDLTLFEADLAGFCEQFLRKYECWIQYFVSETRK